MAHSVPLIVQKSNAKKTAHVKKKESAGKNKKPGKNKETSFSRIIKKAGEQYQLPDKDAIKGKPGEIKLLQFISKIVKSITGKLPVSLKNNLLTLVKKIIRNAGFSEKEKSDLLSTLLEKIQKKERFPASLADKISALVASLDNDIRDVPQKNKLLAGIRGLMDEKPVKKSEIPAYEGTSKLVVIDLRKGQPLKQHTPVQDKTHSQTENNETVSPAIKLDTLDSTSDTISYFSLKDGAGTRGETTDPGTGTRGPAGFDQHMVEKLKTTLQNEIVKHTKLILKENGNGEIRIILKPESLGSIRMRVHLSNNHIDGRIFVENINIKEIVDQAMDNLNAAFKQGGFDSVSLKVSVGQGNEQNQHDDQQERSAEYMQSESAEEFEKNLELLFDEGLTYSRVNLFI